MSNGRGLSGLILATVCGVLSGMAVFGPALQEDQKRRHATDRDEVEDLSAATEPPIGGEKSILKTASPSDKVTRAEEPALVHPSTRPWDWIPIWRAGDREAGKTASLLSGQSKALPFNNDQNTVKDAVTVENPSS